MTLDLDELRHGLSKEQISKNAGYLIQFWRHAFKTRAKHILHEGFVFDSPEVLELIDYALWNGGFGVITAAEQALALNGVIIDNSKKIKKLIAVARKEGHTPEMLAKLNVLKKQAISAEELIELLDIDNG